MSVRFNDLLVIVIPSDFGPWLPNQTALEDDLIGFLIALPNDRSFGERGFDASLGNRRFFAYAKKKMDSLAAIDAEETALQCTYCQS